MPDKMGRNVILSDSETGNNNQIMEHFTLLTPDGTNFYNFVMEALAGSGGGGGSPSGPAGGDLVGSTYPNPVVAPGKITPSKLSFNPATQDELDAVASVLISKENIVNKDTDVTMAANSDAKYPSQKAVKTYVDNTGSGGNHIRIPWPSDEWRGIPGIPAVTGLSVPLNRLYFLPFFHEPSQLVKGLRIYVTTGTASSFMRFGIYQPDPITGKPNGLILDAGTASSDINAASCGVSFSPIALSTMGMTWICGVAQGTSATAIVGLNTRGYLLPGMSVSTSEPATDLNSSGRVIYQASVTGALPAIAGPLATTQASNPMLIQVQSV